jgi:xylulose-5-phosphate/fructose-6-phosphate phosphoketolase
MNSPIGTTEMSRSDGGHLRLRHGLARRSLESPLGGAELRDIDAYWRASLYLCLGMLHRYT